MAGRLTLRETNINYYYYKHMQVTLAMRREYHWIDSHNENLAILETGEVLIDALDGSIAKLPGWASPVSRPWRLRDRRRSVHTSHHQVAIRSPYQRIQ